jgi:hypothetical protein
MYYFSRHSEFARQFINRAEMQAAFLFIHLRCFILTTG